jgi:class 3 adenylate cyclase/pimeloyl-ACP methyl ester carboxylesterase
MVSERFPRKLVAILYADVAGYSRLNGQDEDGTHKLLSGYLDDLAATVIGNGGRVLHYAGDAVLATFEAVVDAVSCAIAIQNRIEVRNSNVPDGSRVQFRIGVNLGDVIEDRGEVYGDGVNIAARLESLAPPGGVCVSGAVHEQVAGKLGLRFEDLGVQAVKNIARPVHVYVAAPSGAHAASGSGVDSKALQQDIRFCSAPDGTQLAYSTVGKGAALVKTANWLNHLEFDWESPVWGHVLRALASDHQLIRYDQRGNGLSDWEVGDMSFEAWVGDLESVVEAAGVERFALFGLSQGGAVAIAYAARHPERVSHLVLYGTYARGKNHRSAATQVEEEWAMTELIRTGWGKDNPAFRQIFTSLLIPGASSQQMDWFNELQRRTATPENAVRIRQTQNSIDVVDQLPDVQAPTLVLHLRDDGVVPFEEGRQVAATIPNAQFVALEGQNHLLLEGDPAWPRFRDEIRAFLSADHSLAR